MKKIKQIKTFFAMTALLLAAAMLMSACGSGGSGQQETTAEGQEAAAGAEEKSNEQETSDGQQSLADDAQGSTVSGENTAADDHDTDAAKNVTLVLDWTPNPNHAGIYIAQALGYFEEAGLSVDIELPAEGTATQMVGAGKGDFGIGNTEDVIHAISLDDPMPVKSVAAIVNHNTSGFVSLKSAGIESPADWAGKTYGGYGGTTEEKIVRYIAEKNGVDPDSITFVDLGNSDTLTALQNGIDFIWVFESTELIGLNKQEVEYNYIPVRECDEVFDYYTPVLIVNTDVEKNDPEMVRAFVEACAGGYEYAAEHPDEAADILLEAVPELDEYMIKEGQDYMASRYAGEDSSWGVQDEEVWQKYEDFLVENGLVDESIDVKNAFTNEYLPE